MPKRLNNILYHCSNSMRLNARPKSSSTRKNFNLISVPYATDLRCNRIDMKAESVTGSLSYPKKFFFMTRETRFYPQKLEKDCPESIYQTQSCIIYPVLCNTSKAGKCYLFNYSENVGSPSPPANLCKWFCKTNDQSWNVVTTTLNSTSTVDYTWIIVFKLIALGS